MATILVTGATGTVW